MLPGMERREERAARERLAHVIGLPVTDPAGMTLGVVVGRIISGTTIDLLVRRRRLFHRSRYLRLQGAAITTSAGNARVPPRGASSAGEARGRPRAAPGDHVDRGRRVNIDLLMLLILVALTRVSAAYVAGLTKL